MFDLTLSVCKVSRAMAKLWSKGRGERSPGCRDRCFGVSLYLFLRRGGGGKKVYVTVMQDARSTDCVIELKLNGARVQ